MRRVIRTFTLLALVACAAPAHAQPADATALSGRWSGTYLCGAAPTALELTLRGNAHGIVRGTFAFSSTAQNPEVPAGSYPVLGRLTGTSLVLLPVDVRTMPEGWVPVGVQATVQGERLAGWIEGQTCGAVTARRTEAALPADALPGGYGAQVWMAIAESGQGMLYLDARDRPGPGARGALIWTRWQASADIPEMELAAGQVVEWELELDCEGSAVRTWHTLIYDAGGELRHVDALAPFAWAQVTEGSLDEQALNAVCFGEPR